MKLKMAPSCDCRCGGFRCTPCEYNGSNVTCADADPCPIPCRNLTLTWLNVLSGGGSTLLVKLADGIWETGCVNQIVYRLDATSGTTIFQATAYTDGTCPTGATTVVSSVGGSFAYPPANPPRCEPFLLVYRPVSPGGNYLIARGYTQFAIAT